MNQINPNKLLLSKWTAIKPENRERHFIVTQLVRDADDAIVGCEIEAVLNHHVYEIDWRQLKDSTHWLIGWR